MPFTGPIEDRLAIHELNASYGDCAGVRDLERWVSLWSEDSQWEHPMFGNLVGRAQIRQTLAAVLDRIPFIQFNGALGHLEVQADQAVGRVWPIEFTCNSDGISHRISGRYDDVYVKRAGAWLFQRRIYSYRQRVLQEAVPVM